MAVEKVKIGPRNTKSGKYDICVALLHSIYHAVAKKPLVANT